MIEGSCHCGAVRFELYDTPQWLTRCTCSYCRRAGWLLAHTTTDKVKLHDAPDDVIKYIQGDRTLAFVSCAICGCNTHWESLDTGAHARMAVNMLMADPEKIKDIPVRVFDGADTWEYLD